VVTSFEFGRMERERLRVAQPSMNRQKLLACRSPCRGGELVPRRPRVHLDGVPLHIVQRGHNRAACFFREKDYLIYLDWLSEALLETETLLHAYALMTNHVHLLITPSCAQSVPKLLISLGRRYVQYINKTYQRSGTLWDGRYRSSLIQAETYLLTCMRYIELNPVRAAMVDEPALYRWTSYRSNALGQSSTLLTPHTVYSQLGANESERLGAYRALFRQAMHDQVVTDLRLALHQSRPIGNARFHAKIERITGERREARPRGRPRTKTGEKEGERKDQGELPV